MFDQERPIKKIKSHYIYHSSWLDIREDEIIKADESNGKYVVVERIHCAVIIPQKSDGKIFLTQEYRYPVERWTWNFTMGSCKKGERYQDGACRELEEETGWRAGKIESLGEVDLVPGYSNEIAHFYLATDLKAGKIKRESSEIGMKIQEFSVEEIDQMIQENKIRDGLSIVAWFFYKNFLKNN
ncbi:MAG: NUDIX hydrolase [Patescibacteria group bacterium]|nr:NUDIX hydrolase [Patescibacteria group bacterium]